MDKVQLVLDTENCTAANIGALDNLEEHAYHHPTIDIEIKGKVFLGELLKSTAMEVSFQMIPPRTTIPFSHSHKENEELYIFIKGDGEFQVNDDKFRISEGSVVRVAPTAKRIWKNTSDLPMIFTVIQARAGSLNTMNVLDGKVVDE